MCCGEAFDGKLPAVAGSILKYVAGKKDGASLTRRAVLANHGKRLGRCNLGKVDSESGRTNKISSRLVTIVESDFIREQRVTTDHSEVRLIRIAALDHTPQGRDNGISISLR